MTEETVKTGKPFLVIKCPSCGQLIQIGELPVAPKVEK